MFILTVIVEDASHRHNVEHLKPDRKCGQVILEWSTVFYIKVWPIKTN